MINYFNIEEVEILIDSIDDWLLVNKNQALIELMNTFSHVESEEELRNLQNQIKAYKMKQEEKFKAEREKAILIQAKLVKLKRRILNEGMPDYEPT